MFAEFFFGGKSITTRPIWSVCYATGMCWVFFLKLLRKIIIIKNVIL